MVRLIPTPGRDLPIYSPGYAMYHGVGAFGRPLGNDLSLNDPRDFMHTYDNLKNRKTTVACAACAESMSFIHVRAPNDSQMRSVLETRSLEVPATRSPKTLESEKALGIPASVYL